LHYGTRPGNHDTTVETSKTNVTVSGLVEGRAYYFIVQAVNASGLESVPSNELSYLVPSPPKPVTPETVSPVGDRSNEFPYLDPSPPKPVTPETVSPVDLPLPWSHMDLGAVNPNATASVTSGVFTIQGSGMLGGSEDTGRFVWQVLSGSGVISARISALENASDSSRIGVMIRDSLAANSKQVFFGVDGGGLFQWVSRNTTGGQPNLVSRTGGGLTNLWIGLKRSGDKITAYMSVDGHKWKVVWKGNRKTLSLGTTCYIGFSVSSGSDAPCTAIFSDVKVIP
jgi:hypothetical protein